MSTMQEQCGAWNELEQNASDTTTHSDAAPATICLLWGPQGPTGAHWGPLGPLLISTRWDNPFPNLTETFHWTLKSLRAAWIIFFFFTTNTKNTNTFLNHRTAKRIGEINNILNVNHRKTRENTCESSSSVPSVNGSKIPYRSTT